MENQKKNSMNVNQNSIGLEMIQIAPGKFNMGANPSDEKAEWDEKPLHEVEITYDFEIGATEITNSQYELYDPLHRDIRGTGRKKGFSQYDDESVVNISWHDALGFCEWLSKKEGKHYRLPTEAEWEYACRAGTDTPYYTGNQLPIEYHKNQELVKKWNAKKFYKNYDLKVGKSTPNPWGLYDMHGNVENWCMDNFTYYSEQKETNPISLQHNQIDGNAKVTRGGSYGVKVEHLRSSRRCGALAKDKNWLIGFRLVCGPPIEELKSVQRPKLSSLCLENVSQEKEKWNIHRLELENKPIFFDPIPYLIEPRKMDRVPLKPHNHCPAVTWCDNGDILVIWFSTYGEHDRDMIILGSRLRKDSDVHDPSSLYFRIPGRNTTGSALLNDENGTIYHINGVEVATSWKTLMSIVRESTNNGEKWTNPKFLEAKHQYRNQIIAGTFLTKKGDIIQLCDAVPSGMGGTAFWISKDKGKTWKDMGRDEKGELRKKPRFWNILRGAWIAGIHGKGVQLKNCDFLAYGRANNIKRKMPQSISSDGGKTWRYSPSEFPAISYGQRLVLIRLREGPLFFASFTDIIRIEGKQKYKFLKGMDLKTNMGIDKKCYGLFGALSFDEGKSWPIRRFIPLTKEKNPQPNSIKGFGLKDKILIDDCHGELKGYLCAIQSPDGIIHLISSHYHYRFNLKWMMEFTAT